MKRILVARTILCPDIYAMRRSQAQKRVHGAEIQIRGNSVLFMLFRIAAQER